VSGNKSVIGGINVLSNSNTAFLFSLFLCRFSLQIRRLFSLSLSLSFSNAPFPVFLVTHFTNFFFFSLNRHFHKRFHCILFSRSSQTLFLAHQETIRSSSFLLLFCFLFVCLFVFLHSSQESLHYCFCFFL